MKIETSQAYQDHLVEVHGARGPEWFKTLPAMIETLEERWSFKYIAPVENLSYGFVARVHYKGNEAILKTCPDPLTIQKEILWLSHFPQVTPQVFAHDKNCGAFLMQKLQPGILLKEMQKENDEEATRVICRLVREMQKMPAPKIPLPHLSEHRHISLLRGHFDEKLVEKAEALYRDLTKPTSSDVVLHGDLHHDNVLKQGADWKVIDPHGYVGDPVFEIAPLMYNPLDILPTLSRVNLRPLLLRRMSLIREETGFSLGHIQAWSFCMTMLSLAWTFEGTNRIPDFESFLAQEFSSLV